MSEEEEVRNPFAHVALQVFKERCSQDLLYSLLFDPETNLKLVLESSIKAFEKKNEPKFAQSELLALWKTEMLKDYADNHVRTYAFLHLLARTPELQKFIKSKVPQEKQDTFDKFMENLHMMIKRVLPWPVRVTNAKTIVQDFCFEASKFYKTK